MRNSVQKAIRLIGDFTNTCRQLRSVSTDQSHHQCGRTQTWSLTQASCRLVFGMKAPGLNRAFQTSDAPGVASRGSRAPLHWITPERVVPEVERHILLDGFRIVVDLEKSHGCRLVDAVTGRELL